MPGSFTTSWRSRPTLSQPAVWSLRPRCRVGRERVDPRLRRRHPPSGQGPATLTKPFADALTGTAVHIQASAPRVTDSPAHERPPRDAEIRLAAQAIALRPAIASDRSTSSGLGFASATARRRRSPRGQWATCVSGNEQSPVVGRAARLGGADSVRYADPLSRSPAERLAPRADER